MILSDIELSRKLERTEARSNADFVETRVRLDPASGAEWIEVGGAYAMFDGVESPLTQTFGLGVFTDTTDAALDQIEAFFDKKGAPVFHEVSPLADASLLELFDRRGYRPIELTSVMFQQLESGGLPRVAKNPKISVRVIDESDADLWAATAAEGWGSEEPGLRDFILAIGRIAARTKGGRSFLAELDGEPIATGGFCVYDDVCILAGASTVPAARNQGAQNALLAARLNFAVANGCRFAMMCAAPGSQSQTNAQKNGFEIAYTRIKWQLKV
ncbi:MAG: GNAT family N-acetyltransferase [Pyrinomonadaceae bacterium]